MRIRRIIIFLTVFLGLTATLYAGDVQIKLKPGVNYISIPNGTKRSVEEVLSNLPQSSRKAAYYDTSQNKYFYFVPDTDYREFSEFEFLRGYWVKNDTAGEVTMALSGTVPDAYSIALKVGWNAIGCPADHEMQIEDVLKPLVLNVDYSSVWRYASNDAPYYQQYSSGKQEFTTLKPGEGYWIRMLKDMDFKPELAVHHPPVLAEIGGKTIAEGEKLEFSVSAADPDGDNLVYSVSGLPEGASFSGTTFSWVPDYGQGGKVYPVTFIVSDGKKQDSKDVKIEVKITGRQIVTGSIKINNDAKFTNTRDVNLTLSAASPMSEVTQMSFSNGGNNWSGWESCNTSKIFHLPESDGEKTVYVKYKDVRENYSASASDTIILDTTGPVISINPVKTPTNQDVTLSYTVSDNFTPQSEIKLTGDGSPYTQNGGYNVTLIATDSAGNSSQKQISFTIKKSGPVIVISSPKNGDIFDTDKITLAGAVDGVPFSEEASLPKDDENIVTKTATDAAGNSGSASVTVYAYPYAGIYIGSTGGESFSQDGLIKVKVPSGALDRKIKIGVLNISEAEKGDIESVTPTGKNILVAAHCRPSKFSFKKDVDIVYSLAQPEVPGTPAELFLYDDIQKKIVSTGKTISVPIDGRTLEFSINHFSTYAALSGYTSTGTPIGGGVKIPLPDMFTGAFGNSVPMTVAPGRKGIQPALGLNYRSANPNSWVGVGYSLNPGYIARSTRLGPPFYVDTIDTFYFVTDAGTTELVHLADNLYQAKIESSFTRFYKNYDDWRVVTKDGATLIFGIDEESKEKVPSGTYSWYVTKVTELNGNSVDYAYLKDQNKVYLKRIDYTSGSGTPKNCVEFTLEDRDDISSSYLSGGKITLSKRLKEIQAKCNGALVWRYALKYEYSQDTNRSLLKSIIQYTSDDKSFPEQKFGYQKAK